MRFSWAAALALAAAFGCGATEALASMDDGPDADFGRRLVAELQAGHHDAIASSMDPRLGTEGLAETLTRMSAMLTAEPPRSVNVVGQHTITFHTQQPLRRVTMSIQYEFADKWLLANLRWREESGGSPIIESFHLQPITDSLETTNRFTFDGKGVAHYLMLATCFVISGFTLYVLVICLRTPFGWRRKALWAAGILIGLGQLQFDWTTGAFALIVSDWHIQLLAAGYHRAGPFGPYILIVSLPFFAILFLWKRRTGRFPQPQPPVP